MAVATFLLTLLSSTTSTLQPGNSTRSSVAIGVLDLSAKSESRRGSTSGRLNEKQEPSPGTLLTLSSPPSASLSCLEMTSPRPVPPKRLVVELSA